MRAMRRGDWESAWLICDRLLSTHAAGSFIDLPRHLQPVWDGRPLAGRRVLVRCYHGLGDTVQFVRFAPRLRRIAREVILWAQPALIPLLRTAGGIDRLIALHDGEPLIDHDADIELMELPHALRILPRDLPGDLPYLGVHPRNCGKEGRVASRIDRAAPVPRERPRHRPRVGIVWQAGVWDPRRSVPVALAERLIERTPGLSWHVLQRGSALAGWESAAARVPRIRGILEEVRVLRTLDLLVTVDTLSAHLAGALDVPVWTLLPPHPDWRWMERGERTLWYPSMRLWRRRPREGWEPLLERVAVALRDWMSGEMRARVAGGAEPVQRS